MRNKFILCLVVIIFVTSSGCSVFMAAHQPDHKNLGVANRGAARNEVLAEFGQPLVTEVDAQGYKTDIFKFKQGFGKGNKASRAVFHGIADVFSLGLWEVVGTPTEAVFSGHEVVLKVLYDKQEMVKDVLYLKGDEEKGQAVQALEEQKHNNKEELKAISPTTNFNSDTVTPTVKTQAVTKCEGVVGGSEWTACMGLK